MILNAYAVLDAFLTVLRSLLALLVLGQSAAALVQYSGWASPDRKKLMEDRYYLLFLLATLLLGLNVVSWPLFYLLLRSYVREWPGVMCIYGVTQVGTGSINVSRFLPGLVNALEATKPALVFLSGAWFVLYLINRQTQTGPLMRRVLFILIVLGGLALADSLVEGAYLVIPKKEEFLSVGCCTAVFDAGSGASRFTPQAILGDRYHAGLFAAYYGLNGAMILALGLLSLRGRGWQGGLALGGLGAVALITLAVSGVFLIEIAAPLLLRLPSHHCPYCLLSDAPESTVAMALFLLGTFAVGWACTARWLARSAETGPIVDAMVRRAVRLGFYGYLGSLVMLSLELALAGAWEGRIG